MQLRLTVVDAASLAGSVGTVEAVVTCSPGTPVAAVRPGLTALVGAPPQAPLFVDGARVTDDHPLGRPPLLEGTVLTVGRPGGSPGRLTGRTGGLLELHVVSGPDAGQVVPLAPGLHRIGRAGAGLLRVEDPDVSRLHAEVAVSATGITVQDLGSTNGTWVDGTRLGGDAAPVTLTSRVTVGSSTLELHLPQAAPVATRVVDGLVEVNRRPRLAAPDPAVELRLPAPPPVRTTPRVPVVALVLPLIVAVPLALLLRSPVFLAIALLSPVLLLGNLVSDRVTGRRDHEAAVAAHEATTRQVRAEVDAAVAAEERRRRQAHPDAAQLSSIAAGPLQRLWERSRGDDDWLDLRVGTGTLPSRVQVHDPATPPGRPAEVPCVREVPVVVGLAGAGVVGVAGDRPRTLALLRSLVGQIATLHSPRDVRLVVLVAAPEAGDQAGDRALDRALDRAPDWAWVAHLPHARPGPDLPADAQALLGAGARQVTRRVGELLALVDRRQAAAASAGAGRWPPGARADPGGCDVVVVLDGAQALRAVPGVARLLTEGPAVGVHLLCADRGPAQLPVECRATVGVGGEVATRLDVRCAPRSAASPGAAGTAGSSTPGGDGVPGGVVADLVPARWAGRLARALAPLRDATPGSAPGGGLPASVRLLDLLPLDATCADDVAEGWRGRPRTTSSPLGVTATGALSVDLAADGPHVLVAGTTGAGKSELLQSLVAGLAVGNRPDELAFVLVDYKGGSAFAECARLPHVVGLVTDLDGALTARALESLGAEVRRRERLLASTGSATLQQHRERSRGPGGPPGPATACEVPARLVLVVDEFRVLAEELPDFLAGLVRLAAVGRSLGVHLVLATQRPAGVVSADIRANVNLRVALRVQDAADSVDVVDAPHAARIPHGVPGRAVVRAGSRPLQEVQVARVSGTRPAPAPAAPSVRRLEVGDLGEPPPRPVSAPSPPGATGPSDLSRLVDAVRVAARLVGAAPPASPWLPPLPDVVTLGDVATTAATPARRSPGPPRTARRCPPAGLRLEYGLLDDPAGQSRPAATWDLAADGPLVVAGTARSGRSSTVRALLTSLALAADPSQAWAFVVDGAGSLADTEALPHVGAVVGPADTERAARLLRRVAAEVDQRTVALARDGAADLVEHRRLAADAGRPGLPWVVLAVDGWEAVEQAWTDAEGTACLDTLHEVVREGPRVGVLVVVAGGRSVLGGRLGAAVGHRLVLRLADPTDVVLAGIPARDVPTPWPPGRGLLVGGRAGASPRQVQVALLDADPGGSAQRAVLRSVAAEAAARTGAGAGLPPTVPAMPTSVGLPSLAGAPGWPLGVGGADVTPLGIDPRTDGRVLLVAGHPGSGRTTTLLTLARSALATGGCCVVAVAPDVSPLRHLQGRPGVVAVLGGADGAALREALDAAGRHGGSTLVVVDDVETLGGRPVEPVLQDLVAAAAATPPGPPVVVVAAGSTPELLVRAGLVAQLRRAGAGVLLGPAGPLDGDLFSVRLPRRTQRLPGRGVVVRRGRVVPVQVARPEEEPGDVPPVRVGTSAPAARRPTPEAR